MHTHHINNVAIVTEAHDTNLVIPYTDIQFLGGEGNLVQLKNTVFFGNRGFTGRQEDYGAAIAFTRYQPIRDASNFQNHEVTNW